MERTFGTDDVYAAITDNFIPLKFDVTEQSDANDALKARYQSMTLPSVLFVDPTDGTVYQRIRSEIEPEAMLKVIEAAAARQVKLKSGGC